MVPTPRTTNTPLTLTSLQEIADHEGPCITLLIPDRHPGSQEGSRAALVRGMTRTAAEQLREQKLSAPSLLEPIEAFASGIQNDEGGSGIALFRSPNFFATARVAGIKESCVTVGRHFHLSPLVAFASAPQEFYILGLNRKNLRLYRYAHGRCESVALPAQIPPSIEVASNLDRSDNELQNQSPSGRSTGAMRAAHFGTSTQRESAPELLHHFFLMVDQGLKEWLRDTPLLLAGVHEEVAAYRRASRHNHLLDSDIQGNIDFLSEAEIAERATEGALTHYRKLGEAVLVKYREMADRRRAKSTARIVLSAAMAGRVHQLCAAEATEVKGCFKIRDSSEEEDLVNASIVDPDFIATVRKKLDLDQREAGEIFGGGVNAFSRYENGKTKPPLALVKLLKVLDRHPDLLTEVRVS